MVLREMGIFLDVQLAIGRGLIKSNAIEEIFISEVLSALETEHGESRILPYI